ncbi:hypothetical protein MUN88_07160 [Gracilibacillus caseinilyticus]|uniref:DUF2157 domain-containing protein n=1 Tax=Gracilibacillus caseinilyticus TaxID=2932256 RepID=A0ABY4F005_9BACI|nr:hypothetical protein [Gracilibacillus caseinilyticus]UOQ49845.1 hypothetical protein MUN88_07160 [Gracilibacillus caseinilyticus]
MSKQPKSEKEKIVGQEMVNLLQAGYINEHDFMYIMKAYKDYTQHEAEPVPTTNATPAAEPARTHAPKKEPKQPIPKSPEQIRERNITWLLILGVSFLLISGLVVATSTWEQMGAALKVLTLLGVSGFFFTLSGISSSILKISKTAFAFLTLGSLLLPIAIIAIGYFELFGSYLSLYGEGKFVLGMLCTLLPLPLYFRNAVQNNSRLFVWIFYLFLSFFVGFTIAATSVSADVFYLLIMLFNAALLFGYHRLRQQPKLPLFIKELPAYAQLNLIVSTLLMLAVFDSALFYSFNVLLTAALYMAMVYVYNTKAYQLVFSALFAYGVYQLTEQTWLENIDLFLYALIGTSYLGFATLVKQDAILAKIFHYTSGFVSFCAFLFISFQGVVIRQEQDSWVLLLAYLIITGTYLYLAEITNRQVFRWLAPVFLFISGMQLWEVVFEPYIPISIQSFMFLFAVLSYIFIAIPGKKKPLFTIKTSTKYLSIFVMLLAVMHGITLENYIEVSLMALIAGGLASYVSILDKQQTTQSIPPWTHAFCWLFACLILYPKLISALPAYVEHFHLPFHFAISGVVLLMISLLWQKARQKILAQALFYMGQAGYLLAVLILIASTATDTQFVRPAILLVGIASSVWLVRYVRIDYLWAVVSVMTFAFYMSLTSTFAITSLDAITVYMLFGPLLLLAVDWVAGKYVRALKLYFFWTAHIMLVYAVIGVIANQIINRTIHPSLFLIPLAIYLYSIWIKRTEWQLKLFLYAAMTMISFLVIFHVLFYDWIRTISISFCFVVSSVLLVLISLFFQTDWKRRMEWYLIPFGNLSLLIVTTFETLPTLSEVGIVIGFVVLNLYLLHRRNWTLALIVPLMLLLLMWRSQQYLTGDVAMLLIYSSCFASLTIAGKVSFQKLFDDDNHNLLIDWYSLFAVLYAGFTFTYAESIDSVWVRILPYILIAGWLFLQVKRISQPMMQKVVMTAGALCMLPAYYLIFQEYMNYIPDLFHAEIVMLPVFVLSILLTRKIWQQYTYIMIHVQTVILAFITIYLVQDAIVSHTVWDALIIGILSLASLLAGMYLQIKSYFFIGLGTLLFNVIYQTKPYWGNMPWWAYLLMAGILLIAIASYNEWKKQRDDEGRLEKKVKGMIVRFREWN